MSLESENVETIDLATAFALGAHHTGLPRPPGFPPGIPVQQRRFEDWSLYIDVPKIWVASPRSEQDVVTICNWARGANHRVRALGHSHNWSPLVVPGDTHASAPVVLVDTSRLVGSPTFQMVDGVPTATFGVGTTVEAATLFLQSLDNGGTGGAPGYTFQNMTAPGALSLGGVLAIGAHGTGVPCGAAEPHLNGCMSNLVLSYKAVVTDPNAPAPAAYEVRRFDRADPDAPAFLVHLGRAFLTEVTLRVVPNYYLQVTNWYPDAEVLFQEPQAGVVAPPQALATLLDRYGRVEVIWFPFTTAPWVKTWELKPDRIEPQVAGPYNYPWANRISKFESQLIKGGLFVAPHLTPAFGALQVDVAKREAPEGATMNGTARDLLLYVEDTTLRVTACGYALQIPRSRVQEVVRSFYVQYTAMLESYRQAGRFPVNGPVELRFTTIDRQDDLGVPGAAPPAIAATHSVDPADAELDTVFWVDSLTLPGTSGSGEFFTELESWMIATWGGGPTNGLRPEWSKGWAYTPTGGPWTDADKIASTIPATYDQPAVDPWTFEWARATLARYDAHNLFTNPFLDLLFTDGRADG